MHLVKLSYAVSERSEALSAPAQKAQVSAAGMERDALGTFSKCGFLKPAASWQKRDSLILFGQNSAMSNDMPILRKLKAITVGLKLFQVAQSLRKIQKLERGAVRGAGGRGAQKDLRRRGGFWWHAKPGQGSFKMCFRSSRKMSIGRA